MESHSGNTLMTCPALARSCKHSTVLSCTSIPEARPKNPPAAGQNPPGPQAERGAAWHCPSNPPATPEGTVPAGLHQRAAHGRVAEMVSWEGAALDPGELPSDAAEVS